MAQRVHESIEVQAPFQDVFTYWSNLENFPQIMSNVEEVRIRPVYKPLEGEGTSWQGRRVRRQDHRDEPEARHWLE